MKIPPRRPGWPGYGLLFAAVLCSTGSALRAQSVYNTTFDSRDTVNGAPASPFTPYSSPNQPVDNLDGQNNWVSTDPLPANGNAGTASQINGGADYVGNFGTFFGDNIGTSNFAGALGGNQRNANPSPQAPDVVPSSASGGAVMLSHPLTSPTPPAKLTIDVDFVLTGPSTTFASRDSFSFSLRNTANSAALISINFSPATDGSMNDNVTTTVGTAVNATTGTGLALNSNYHMHLVLTAGASGTYAATFSDPSSGVSYGSFGGSLSTSSITLANVANFAVGWTLASATVANGGYTGAGSNALAFDNLLVVPEPSTYALLAVGACAVLGARCGKKRGLV